MIANENTKIMARLHKMANNRGMNIYNPYFEKTNTNAVYLLFYNKDPKPLVDGIRLLNISGAIPAGFETDPTLIELLDNLGPISKKIQRAGIIVQRNGKLKGYYQAPYGLLESIRTKTDIKGKKLVILGAGTVTTGFLTKIKLDRVPVKEIEIYNRTVKKAENLAAQFPMVKKVGTLKDMEDSSGDIFINATNIGSPWNNGSDYKFSEELIEKFNFVADVTFVPLKPQLIEVAEKIGKPYSPGHRMFLYQGKMCLEKILGIDVDLNILSDLMLKDFEKNWS